MNMNDDNDYDNEILAKAARLATPVAPERDLWPEIEQVIAAPVVRQRSAWNTVWAQAAAVILLVGGSSGLTYLAMSGDAEPGMGSGADAVVSLRVEPVTANFGSRYHLGPDYVDARRLVANSFDERLDDLSPEAREVVLANIETIRRAIEDINAALADDPDNVLLQRMLIDTYRDELSVMKAVDTISNNAMLRKDI